MRTEAHTGTLVGELVTESHRTGDHAGDIGYGLRFAPVGRPARNDGWNRAWLSRGEVRRLEHDGTGWHITADGWTDGHVYRLAEPLDGQLVDTLPTADGEVRLERGRVYEIREVAPMGEFGLYVL